MEHTRRNFHHSDIVLEGSTNYLGWKLTLQRILDGLRLLGHIDGSAVMPIAPYFTNSSGSAATDEDTGATITPAILEAFEKRLEKWHSNESSAKMIICQTVSMEIRTGIAELSSFRHCS